MMLLDAADDTCHGCSFDRGDTPLRDAPRAFDDYAVQLAREGKSAHEIAHVMMLWASEASERAIYWADKTTTNTPMTEESVK